MVDEDRFRRDVPCQRGVGDEMQRKGERHSVTSLTTIAFGFSGCCCFLVKYGTPLIPHHLFSIALSYDDIYINCHRHGKKSCACRRNRIVY